MQSQVEEKHNDSFSHQSTGQLSYESFQSGSLNGISDTSINANGSCEIRSLSVHSQYKSQENLMSVFSGSHVNEVSNDSFSLQSSYESSFPRSFNRMNDTAVNTNGSFDGKSSLIYSPYTSQDNSRSVSSDLNVNETRNDSFSHQWTAQPY